MQEEMRVTSRSPSFEEVTSDSPVDGCGDEQRIVDSLEPDFDGESPIVGLVLGDEAERSERGGGDGHDEDRLDSDGDEDDDDDDDFEFTFAGVDRESEWCDQPGEIFPIFNRRLLSEAEARAIQAGETRAMETVRSGLKKLFVAEDQDEAAEVEGAAAGNSRPAMCKKSSSTGSTARRWGVSLRELLIRRSRSGRGSFVRLGSRRRAAEKRRETYLPYKKAIAGLGFFRV
uniref:Uncharacterized protein n=1 Tax=Kalanchoe fedtschenkoi TaxID=63787 RepID=A0A7N0TPA6_KALFE